jgi:LysM repeat protein
MQEGEMPIKISAKKPTRKDRMRRGLNKYKAATPKPKTDRQLMAGMKKGGSMKKKGYAMGGAMKKKGMKKGGKLKMVTNDKGERVPFFAADGVGKSAKGGMMKKKGYAMGGAMKKKGMKKGGMMKKKGYAKGGSVKVKSGDTLSQIAKSKGLTLKALLDANPSIKNANMIRVGQSIKIPNTAKPGGSGAVSKNPYAGLSKTQMNMLRSKDKGTQKAATRGMRAQTRTTPSPTKAAAVKASKDGSKAAMEKARANRAAAKKVPVPTSKPAKPTRKRSPGRGATPVIADVKRKPSRRDGRKAMGGMMKKKGMSKGGAMKRSKGGTVRGAGAATRGKRFGRAG